MKIPKNKWQDDPQQKGREAAEYIAIKAIEYFAANPESLGSFLAHAGVGPGDLKSAMTDPKTSSEFLGGVLDYMMMDEKMLLNFAETMGISPPDIVKARLCFPGGDAEMIC